MITYKGYGHEHEAPFLLQAFKGESRFFFSFLIFPRCKSNFAEFT